MKRGLKLLLGIILLPLAFCILLSVCEVVLYLVKAYRITVWFFCGAALYALIHFFLYNFSRFYVFAHEFSHAAAAWLCGYKVKGMTIGGDSGAVQVSNINTFVLLAPYCIPLYSIALTLIYLLCNWFWPAAREYNSIFLGLFGFFTMLHLLHTYKALTETEQSDIVKAGGGIFSFSLIVLINMAVVLFLLEIYFPKIIPIWALTGGIIRRTIVFWKWLFEKLYLLVVKIFPAGGHI